MSEYHGIPAAEIDAAADALRQHAYANVLLKEWSAISNSQRKKWRDKAVIALKAARDVREGRP